MSSSIETRGTVGRKKKHRKIARSVEEQILSTPDIPVVDEFRMETVEFKCWRCLRLDYREKNNAEIRQMHGQKLFCIACERPDLFEWKTEKLDNGDKREYIRPLTARETYNKVSPEARLLAEKQALAQTLRARKARVMELTALLEVEFMSLCEAIPVAEADVIEAEKKVAAAEHDDLGKKLKNVEDLKARVMRLTAEIDAAKRLNANEFKAAASETTGGGDVAKDAT